MSNKQNHAIGAEQRDNAILFNAMLAEREKVATKQVKRLLVNSSFEMLNLQRYAC